MTWKKNCSEKNIAFQEGCFMVEQQLNVCNNINREIEDLILNY